MPGSALSVHTLIVLNALAITDGVVLALIDGFRIGRGDWQGVGSPLPARRRAPRAQAAAGWPWLPRARGHGLRSSAFQELEEAVSGRGLATRFCLVVA